MRVRRLGLLLLLPFFVAACSSAHGVTWQQPTAEELTMTADSFAPNADAIYLYVEEKTDASMKTRSVYVRLKVLREAGKRYGDVELGTFGEDFQFKDVHGRTIHPDGTVIDFKGKPYKKTIIKAGRLKYRTMVFSLPDVEVGSILEYSYKIYSEFDLELVPKWTAQGREFIRREHFGFHPSDDHDAKSLASTQRLPPGAKVELRHGWYELDLANVPAIPREDFEPPLESLAYLVRFYYSFNANPQVYWEAYGKSWSTAVDGYVASTPSIVATTSEWTGSAKTDRQKAEALYAAVMKLDNTSLSREHSEKENKAEGVKEVRNANDVLALRRGTPGQLALLYLALLRAAGLKAYAMRVVSRDRAMFQPAYPSASQLDDTIVILSLDGKDIFSDPGERYATFGHLHWKHADVGGIRQQDGGTAIAHTPAQNYPENLAQRAASLTLAADGSVTGSVTVALTGTEAMEMRQRAIETDEQALKREWDEEIKPALPSGLMMHTDHFVGLADPGSTLVVQMVVGGSLGTATGKRLLVPLSVFSAGVHNPFTSSHRESIVDLRYPYYEKDEVELHLPAGMSVETLPGPVDLKLTGMAAYVTKTTQETGTITYRRDLAMSKVIYRAAEYPQLKGFFDDLSNRDRAEAVLRTTAK